MKTRLPALAAALLLAAAPAFADDLLDAVLWDGPSAFPSTAEPAPVPPPPPAPELPPPPAPPAPSYPSRSSYAPRSPSLPPPAAPEPSATATVPATAAPASLSGEARIRREIQEMRDRADRLEAALGPTQPAKPAKPPYDRSDWPQRVRLALRGAIVADDFSEKHTGMGGGELAIPLTGTSFDVAVRAYGFRGQKGGWDFDSRIDKTVLALTGWGIWYPFRGQAFSPHVGVGIGYQQISGERYYGLNSRNWDYEELPDHPLTLAGRIGVTLTYRRFTLTGEILLASETREYLAEAGLRVWQHLVLNALVEYCDIDEIGPHTAVGGGITILF